MNKNYIVYDSTGTILRSGSCPENDVFKQVLEEEDANVLQDDGVDDTHYVELLNGPKVELKNELNLTPSKTTILAGGVDETLISNIPEGVFVTWPDGQRDEVTDGVVEFSTTQPGTYVLTFTGVKYLTEEVSIEAHI